MIRLRDLFIRIGFQADEKPLKDIEIGLDRIKSTVKGLTYMFIGSTGLAAGIGYFLEQSGHFEQVNVSFETMLGSAEAATKMMGDLEDLAMRTPLDIKGLYNNTKMLLGMGIAAEDMMEELEHLGNVAAGLSVPLERLALNYGQVLAQSKLTLREVRDFAFAGVPILEVLSFQLKKTVPEIQSLIQAGQITFEQTKEAFKFMATDGRFADLLLKQANTLIGTFKVAKNIIYLISKDIGDQLLPSAKKIMKSFIEWAKINRKLVKTKLATHLKIIGKTMLSTFKLTRWFVNEIGILIADFGGFERVLKTVGTMLLLYFGFSVISGIGGILNGVYTLTTAFMGLGKAAAFVKILTFLEPLLIGAGFLFLIGLLQDIHGYLTGKDSLTGLLNNILREKFPSVAKALEVAFGTVGTVIQTTIKSIILLAKILGNIITLNYSDFEKNLSELKTTWPEAFATIRNVSEENLGAGHKEEFVDPTAITARPMTPGWIQNLPPVLNAPITINVEGGTEDNAEYISWQVREELGTVINQAAKDTKSQEKR